MSRPTLRLVEPLHDAMDFPAGKSDSTGIREVSNQHEINSCLQLFLLWPNYASAYAKVVSQMVKVKFSIDSELAELDQLLLSVNEDTFNIVKTNQSTLEEIYIEVFGITVGFQATFLECAEIYMEGSPCIAISLPEKMTRYKMRESRRIRLSDAINVTIENGLEVISGAIIEISPSALCFKHNKGGIVLNDRVSLTFGDNKFDVLSSSTNGGRVLLKPIPEEPNNFGHYFDFYISHAYPSLKSRFSFPVDPIPELMIKTGQAKKHANFQNSQNWNKEIQDAYFASKDAKDIYVANFVAVDDHQNPIGTSSLAKAYIDKNGSEIWAFHGVGIVQDPNFLIHTCALYNWRVDYIHAKSPVLNSNVIVWYDGRGRWLEKVYTKFAKLTLDSTKLIPIKHNRYVRSDVNSTNDAQETILPVAKQVCIGKFLRHLFAGDDVSIGLGVPYLNYSGILNNIFFHSESTISATALEQVRNTISNILPDSFFVETALSNADIRFSQYSMTFVDATNRQCMTTSKALMIFSSSLEHSQAVVRRKYGF